MAFKRGLGWKPGRPKFGTKWIHFDKHAVDSLPATSSRFAFGLPPIWDQGDLGSCTAHGILRAFLFANAKQGGSDPMLSRLQLYYNERVIEGDPNQDGGAAIGDGLTAISTQGVCPESEWPYVESQFAVKPPAQCYADAVKHEALQHAQVAVDIDQVKAVIASGYPVIVGFTCYQSLMSDQTAATGIVPMPTRGDPQIGGHCVCLNGDYDDDQELIGFDNSWSEQWGQSGSGQFPYAYFTENLMDDFWVITTTNDANIPAPSPNPTPAPASTAPALSDVAAFVGKQMPSMLWPGDRSKEQIFAQQLPGLLQQQYPSWQ